MTKRARLRDALTSSARSPVARLVEEGSNRILVAHIPERDFGLGQAVLLALDEIDAKVLDLNPAYLPDLEQRISRGDPIQDVLPARTNGKGPVVVWLTGWGSRPGQADDLLRLVAPIIRKHADLRLAILNNASAIPVQFPEHGPAAWPDAESFADHVADLAGVDRGHIDIWIPNV